MLSPSCYSHTLTGPAKTGTVPPLAIRHALTAAEGEYWGLGSGEGREDCMIAMCRQAAGSPLLVVSTMLWAVARDSWTLLLPTDTNFRNRMAVGSDRIFSLLGIGGSGRGRSPTIRFNGS